MVDVIYRTNLFPHYPRILSVLEDGMGKPAEVELEVSVRGCNMIWILGVLGFGPIHIQTYPHSALLSRGKIILVNPEILNLQFS